MTYMTRFPLLICALTTAFCATTLSLVTSKAVNAQGITVLSTPQSYYSTPQHYYSVQQSYYSAPQSYYIAPQPYGYSQPYYSAPQPYQGGYQYNSFGPGYSNVYQSGYRGYGAANFKSTVYTNGPYVYGSPGMFARAAPSLFQGTSYGAANQVFRYGSPSYAPAYGPTGARYYSPYGYRRY
jgi:hypothetical protein